MPSQPQIVVITHGRFHSFDLAEQLQDAGRLGAVFTGYPRFKLKNTRVRPELIRSFPWFVTPYLALTRLRWFPTGPLQEWAWHGGEALSRYAARHLPECGVVTALSGSGREAGREIQRRGGVFVCDRGSTHVRWAERILEEEYEKLGMPWHGIDRRAIENEEIEYEMADAVTLPSRFTLRSFTDMGVPESKLRLVPYGVNVTSFRRSEDRAVNFRVLFVGQLCVRKGLHYLLETFGRLQLPGAELILVGGRTADTETLLRRHPVENLVVAGHLSREGVAREMSRASVMVLPSVEEGLALVMAQALACGCPVIASTHTGAGDLFDDGQEGFIVPPRDTDALADRLVRLYRDPNLAATMGEMAVERVKKLGGWDSYGRLSLKVFDELLVGKGVGVPAC
jgi:glycosyltransferase involved in cell wall biosynthesis